MSGLKQKVQSMAAFTVPSCVCRLNFLDYAFLTRLLRIDLLGSFLIFFGLLNLESGRRNHSGLRRNLLPVVNVLGSFSLLKYFLGSVHHSPRLTQSIHWVTNSDNWNSPSTCNSRCSAVRISMGLLAAGQQASSLSPTGCPAQASILNDKNGWFFVALLRYA